MLGLIPEYEVYPNNLFDWRPQALARWQTDVGWELFLEHEYWTCAWISQEVASATHIRLLAGDIAINAKELVVTNNRLHDIFKSPHITDFWTYVGMIKGIKRPGQNKLLNLLCELPTRKCMLPRARAYSMLSLASDGSGITVDYNYSELSFVTHFMRAYESSMCIYSVGIIACSRWTNSLFEDESLWPIEKRPVLEVEVQPFAPYHKRRKWHCCPTCHHYLPENWEGGTDYVICLK
jgi:hypothetical protein